MNYWLMKSEPSEYSIDDLHQAPERRCEWFGVRNYQARNFMRDTMRVGDLAFFWHSSCPQPGVVGIVEVATPAHADSSQFDPDGDYFDPKASLETPRWMCVDVQYVRHTPLISPAMLRQELALATMVVLRRGNRLSITPVSAEEWSYIHARWL